MRETREHGKEGAVAAMTAAVAAAAAAVEAMTVAVAAAVVAGQDRFERVDFADWKAGGGTSGGDSKAEQAEAEIRLLLSDGEWHSRAEIIDALRSEGIGRDAVDGALSALEAAGVTCARREGRGGTGKVRLNNAATQDGIEAVEVAPEEDASG